MPIENELMSEIIKFFYNFNDLKEKSNAIKYSIDAILRN